MFMSKSNYCTEFVEQIFMYCMFEELLFRFCNMYFCYLAIAL